MNRYTIAVPITKMAYVVVEAEHQYEAIQHAHATIAAPDGFEVEWGRLLVKTGTETTSANYTCGKCKEHGGCSEKWCPVR